MAVGINTNLASLSAQRALGVSQGESAQAMKRLSTGLRINSASDDAAGLAIASRFTSQINGMNQAIRNGNDAISLIQTAEGALTEATSILQRMREIAVQSANTTMGANDRTALQAEVTQLSTELNRISSTTAFNNVKLLDGTFSSKAFHVGTNATDTISVTIANSAATAIGNSTINAVNGTDHEGTGALTEANATLAGTTHTIEAQTLTISGTLGSTTVSVADASSAATIAGQVNGVTSSTGVSATAATKLQLDTLSADGTVTFTLGDGTGNTAAISATVTTTDLTNLATAINNTTGTHGITASASGGTLTLENTSGNDIDIDTFNHTTGSATISAHSLDQDGSENNTAETVTQGAADSITAVGYVVFTDDKSFSVTSDVAASAGSITSAAANTATASTQAYVSSVNVSTQSGATSALAVIDGAIDRVSSIRGDLGAVQNRFEFTVSNLSGTSENLSAAKSRIMDADFAQETAALAKSQILQQAGISVLAQANAQPQNVLALLQ
ncbi:MAG: flagellin [Pseudomonadota bacterium]|nr:flagellin [Pseudomonadota bacterium]